LPDLLPFFRLALRYNRRQVAEAGGMLAFKTPDPWQRTPGIKPRYEDVHFERRPPSQRKGTILGIGNRVFDAALAQACQLTDSFAVSHHGETSGLLFVFRTYDRITGNPAQPKSIVLGVFQEKDKFRLLKDWQVLQSLNAITIELKPGSSEENPPARVAPGAQSVLQRAAAAARAALSTLDLPFRQPELELLGIISCSGSKIFYP
jgi:hypothetical protein